MVLRLAASRSRASAEMWSPVDRIMTSPGTSSREGTLFSSPSRTTLALGAAMSLSACMVLSARKFCTKPRMALTRTMTMMIPASRNSSVESFQTPIPADIMAAMMRMMTM
ncbi:hypothetical protein DSECCO2_344430 [anaerobic digester metagenome]